MPTINTAPHTSEALLRVVQERDAEVVFLKLMVDKLALQLLRAHRAQYGRFSEQLDDPLIALIEGAPLYEHPALKAVPKPAAADGASINRQLPEYLPRENHVHRPAATDAAHDTASDACGCPACGGRLRQIGADVSEQLEYVPARFKVIRHVRPKLACVSRQTIFQAVAPSRSIARGVAGPALLANVLVSKILRPHPAAPLGPHPCLRGRGLRSLDLRRLGRAEPRLARPLGRRALSLHAGQRQGPRRRHAGAGARPGSWAHEDRTALGLRARRSPGR